MKKSSIKIFIYFSITSLLIGILLHILSYFPSLRTSNDGYSSFLSVTALISFAVSLKATQEFTSESKPMEIWDESLKGTPKIIKILIFPVVCYVIFNFIYSLFILNGGLQPEIIDGKYVLESKGRIVEEISEVAYFKHIAYSFRGTTGHPILFQFLALALLTSVLNLKKKNHNI